ncbi:MAG: alkaline phosphatase family protein [Pedobacter sp.]|nr:alkaline phosphatase family protein [Pedobacter sp.]
MNEIVKAQHPLARPKLVVGLVVDQMRWDYLYRFADRFGKGGFRRLLQNGFVCQNATLDYIPAFTACGHASIYTGTFPAIHGITGNEWIVQETGIQQYCVSDSTVNPVGSVSKAGLMSPRNLLVTTLGDELKLATNFRAKVIGIAIKDRGAILPAGHAADAAYWFDESTGDWITSSYYRSSLPGWAIDFNRLKMADRFLQQGWDTRYPIQSYTQSTIDGNSYEGAYQNEEKPVFPHRFIGNGAIPYPLFKSTPFANTLTFEFAKAALKAESLGQDQIPDLLAISLSGTDYIGHQFGPNSIEIEDAYLRLDHDLEDFLNYLDQTVGAENYTFFLTADHGGAHNPTFLKDHQLPGGYWDAKALQLQLNNYFESKYGIKDLVRPFLNYQLQFNDRALKKGIDLDEIKKECINMIIKEPGMANVIDLAQLQQATLPEPLKTKAINGYYAKRSGMLQLIPESGWFQRSTDQTGSIHGAWNAYDSHIPLIFMGWGIKKGTLNKTVAICDIAPTIAALLHIQVPSGNIGHVIVESRK